MLTKTITRPEEGRFFYMAKQTFPFSFFEDKFVKTEDAKVSIMTNALQYGNGIFDGIRGYYNKNKKTLFVFRLDDHFERFFNALKIIDVLLPYSKKRLKHIVINLAKKNQPKTDSYFRPFAYASSYNISPNFDQDECFKFCLFMIPLGDYLPTKTGISAMVSSWRRVSDNAIPARAKISGSYVNSSLAKKQAVDFGFDEAIVLNETGNVAEGSAANFFLVKNNVLITPTKTDDILEGITRRTILELANNQKIKTEERTVDRTELYTADEAFFTGTGVQLSWINNIDRRMIGNGKRGKITGHLQDLFFEIVRGENKKYSQKWCTPIKFS